MAALGLQAVTATLHVGDLRLPCEHGRFIKHWIDFDEPPAMAEDAVCPGGFNPSTDQIIDYLIDIGALVVRTALQSRDGRFMEYQP